MSRAASPVTSFSPSVADMIILCVLLNSFSLLSNRRARARKASWKYGLPRWVCLTQS